MRKHVSFKSKENSMREIREELIRKKLIRKRLIRKKLMRKRLIRKFMRELFNTLFSSIWYDLFHLSATKCRIIRKRLIWERLFWEWLIWESLIRKKLILENVSQYLTTSISFDISRKHSFAIDYAFVCQTIVFSTRLNKRWSRNHEAIASWSSSNESNFFIWSE